MASPPPSRSDSKRLKLAHAADEKKPTAAAAPGCFDDNETPAARAGMMWLPELEVTQILSWDPRSVEPYKAEIMRRMLQDVRPNAPEEPLRVLAKSLNENAREKFICFQSWVRAEFDGKGYVEVPDELIRDREEAQKGHEGQIPIDDPHLPADKYFTTVYSKDDNADEKLVFSFTKTKKADSDYVDSGEDEDEESDEESDEDEEESECD